MVISDCKWGEGEREIRSRVRVRGGFPVRDFTEWVSFGSFKPRMDSYLFFVGSSAWIPV